MAEHQTRCCLESERPLVVTVSCCPRCADLGVIQTTDYMKLAPNSAHQLFVAAQGVWAFEQVHGHLPAPNNEADVDEVCVG